MESTGPHHFAMEGWISCAPFERLMHMKIVEASGGKATLTMPFLIDFAQGAGLLHGGALVSLADTAVVMAIKSALPPQTHFATISLKLGFSARCDGESLRLGRRLPIGAKISFGGKEPSSMKTEGRCWSSLPPSKSPGIGLSATLNGASLEKPWSESGLCR
jgi:uncharacterized protein (TIGR00369 family)